VHRGGSDAPQTGGANALNLTLFPADKGDCVLVTGSRGERFLVDGGMRSSFANGPAEALAELKRLDVVCVSHIDQDHISGILQMMDDLVAWRVHRYQVKSGNGYNTAPKAPEPPEIGEIWHNAFHEQIQKNAGPIERLLAATSTVLSGAETSATQALAQGHQNLATSVREGIQLSRRVGEGELNIPVNPPTNGGLMYVRDESTTVRLGGMRITVIGPFEEDLEKLRDEWDDWLRKNRAVLAEMEHVAPQEVSRRPKTEVQRIVDVAVAQARVLGDRGRVTVPNLASLMLLVEEAGRTVLLTGDGAGQDVLKGLAHAKRLDERGGIHVNVLKVQHHGSENNIDPTFCRAVTADHYVFCANGAHENPDLAVVDAVIDSRIGSARERSPNPQGGKPFTLWFNSSSAVSETDQGRAHMEEVEDLVRGRRTHSMKAKFRRTMTTGVEVSL
jgi:beta-lactamase superfamily II metal-dependent hydrolase